MRNIYFQNDLDLSTTIQVLYLLYKKQCMITIFGCEQNLVGISFSIECLQGGVCRHWQKCSCKSNKRLNTPIIWLKRDLSYQAEKFLYLYLLDILQNGIDRFACTHTFLIRFLELQFKKGLKLQVINSRINSPIIPSLVMVLFLSNLN